MLLFEFLAILGVAGFAIMALMGMGHSVHFGHHHFGGHAHMPMAHTGRLSPAGHVAPAGPAGHIAKGGPAAHLAKGGAVRHGQAAKGGQMGKGAAATQALMLLMPTPIDLFAIMFGIGAGGILFGTLLKGSTLWLAAIGVGIAFDFLVIRQLMNFAFRYAAHESEGLESMVANTAKALTNFDSTGRGLAEIVLDGRLVQVLAKLEEPEIIAGTSVKKGDELVVTAVDAKSGHCRVTRELSE